jgi:hypothetical protein
MTWEVKMQIIVWLLHYTTFTTQTETVLKDTITVLKLPWQNLIPQNRCPFQEGVVPLLTYHVANDIWQGYFKPL